jgi:hypothetical protein
MAWLLEVATLVTGHKKNIKLNYYYYYLEYVRLKFPIYMITVAHVPEFTSQLKTQTKENLVNIMHVGVYMCLAFPFRSRLSIFSQYTAYISWRRNLQLDHIKEYQIIYARFYDNTSIVDIYIISHTYIIK